MIRNTLTREIFSQSRYNNFWFKSIIVFFVLLMTLGIFWKKIILLKIPKHQQNVLTLSQTVATILLIYTNNVLCDYLLSLAPSSEILFILEELRVILMENIITRSQEWSTVFGPDPSRYCALIGWDHDDVTL